MPPAPQGVGALRDGGEFPNMSLDSSRRKTQNVHLVRRVSSGLLQHPKVTWMEYPLSDHQNVNGGQHQLEHGRFICCFLKLAIMLTSFSLLKNGNKKLAILPKKKNSGIIYTQSISSHFSPTAHSHLGLHLPKKCLFQSPLEGLRSAMGFCASLHSWHVTLSRVSAMLVKRKSFCHAK